MKAQKPTSPISVPSTFFRSLRRGCTYFIVQWENKRKTSTNTILPTKITPNFLKTRTATVTAQIIVLHFLSWLSHDDHMTLATCTSALVTCQSYCMRRNILHCGSTERVRRQIFFSRPIFTHYYAVLIDICNRLEQLHRPRKSQLG